MEKCSTVRASRSPIGLEWNTVAYATRTAISLYAFDCKCCKQCCRDFEFSLSLQNTKCVLTQ